MDEQICLFQDNDLETKLLEMFLDISQKLGYHENIFSIRKNYSKKGKNAGKLISTAIEINEESFPYDAHNKISKVTSVFLIYLRVKLNRKNQTF